MPTIQIPLVGMIPPTVPLAIAILAVGLYVLYRMALPKPIPGIPYNKEATENLFGDLPSIMKAMSEGEGSDFWKWILEQPAKHKTPIFQVWARPLAKPWVLLTDFRESQDILMRRTKEFDRSNFFGDLFAGTIPNHHIRKLSQDPKFKSNRALVKDLMTPAFLNNVSAPSIYVTFSQLIDLWKEKVRLANNHPFSGFDDIFNTALDAICAATFPFDTKNSMVNSQLRLLQPMKRLDGADAADKNEAVEFPTAPSPPAFQAIRTITDSSEVAMKSPFPVFAHWLLRQTPSMKRAMKAKNDYFRSELAKAEKRFTEGKNAEVRCAMEDILKREVGLAKKENRKPVYNTPEIYDELFGILIGGYDTTATTTCWAMKFFADHLEIQTKLRGELQKSYAAAWAEKRAPTPEEIIKTPIPYLDACIEEVNRRSTTATGVIRQALVDAPVLGHMIPKGTDVLLLNSGGDSLNPPVDANIPENLRSESSRAAATARTRIGTWNPQDVKEFKPERWLEMEDGKEVFNAQAGPMLCFGLGPRGCFGRRLAYLELRLVLVLILWNFELHSVPAHLNSYACVDKLTHLPAQTYVRLAPVM